MARKRNWERALAEYIADRQSRPFVWGDHDCCQFAAGWILECTGKAVDMPNYSTAIGAARKIADEGSLLLAVKNRLGNVAHPNFCQRGDVAMIEVEGRQVMGVITYGGVVVPSETGLVCFDRSSIIAAWRVT